MDSEFLVGIGFIIFASLTTQLPHVMFRHLPKLTGGALANQYPELGWIRFAYPILSTLWFLVFGFVPIYLILRSGFDSLMPFQSVVYVLGGAIGSTSILHGLLGLVTNVCPIPQKRNRLYVYDEDMYTNALLLMAAGVFVVVVAIVMVFFDVL